MSKLLAGLSCIVLCGCFQEPDEVDSETGGSGTGAADSGGSSTGAADSGGSSTGEPDPVETCRSCSSDRCTTYSDACNADEECAACVAAPKSLGCLANPLFHPLAFCSCDECADDCGYMCPGGQGACDSCTLGACPDEDSACLADVECAPCLDDPFREGCAENATYMAADACSCGSCGQECIWTCPEAGNLCANCMNMTCAAPLGACFQDTQCSECFENPALEGCDDSAPFAALLACVCGQCTSDCGLLFEC